MVDKDKVQFVYTLSSTREFVKQLIRSVKTLTNYTDPENITVFYTPPHDEEHEQVIRDLGVNLVKQENETEGFSTQLFGQSTHYGEKLKLCDIDSETVVFLDCDTLILGDIFEVIEGDFDFKARPDISGVEEKQWRQVFERNNKEYTDWVPNAGFMIFKNSVHQELRKEWQEFLEKDLDYYHGGNNKEQFALALAISDYKKHKMSNKDHVMEFNDEEEPNGVVYHLLTPNKTKEQIMMALKRKTPALERFQKKWMRLNTR